MYYVYRCPVVDEGWSHLKTLNETVRELTKSLSAKTDNAKEHHNPNDLLMAANLLDLFNSIPDKFVNALVEEPHVIWMPEAEYSIGLKPALLLKSHSGTQWFVTQLKIDCSLRSPHLNREWELEHKIDIKIW